MDAGRKMLGQTFNRLTVVAYSHANKQGRLFWVCACVCGSEAVVAGTRLRDGSTKSCGCARTGVNKKHGLSKTGEYSCWSAMMHRCYDAKRKDFAVYGGAGIRVCAAWHKFEKFYADMGARPSTAHTIERRNTALGYTPRNCYWADRRTQARNRSSNVLLRHGDLCMTMAEWAAYVGRPHSTLSWRKQQGWATEEIIFGRRV